MQPEHNTAKAAPNRNIVSIRVGGNVARDKHKPSLEMKCLQDCYKQLVHAKTSERYPHRLTKPSTQHNTCPQYNLEQKVRFSQGATPSAKMATEKATLGLVTRICQVASKPICYSDKSDYAAIALPGVGERHGQHTKQARSYSSLSLANKVPKLANAIQGPSYAFGPLQCPSATSSQPSGHN